MTDGVGLGSKVSSAAIYEAVAKTAEGQQILTTRGEAALRGICDRLAATGQSDGFSLVVGRDGGFCINPAGRSSTMVTSVVIPGADGAFSGGASGKGLKSADRGGDVKLAYIEGTEGHPGATAHSSVRLSEDHVRVRSEITDSHVSADGTPLDTPVRGSLSLSTFIGSVERNRGLLADGFAAGDVIDFGNGQVLTVPEDQSSMEYKIICRQLEVAMKGSIRDFVGTDPAEVFHSGDPRIEGDGTYGQLDFVRGEDGTFVLVRKERDESGPGTRRPDEPGADDGVPEPTEGGTPPPRANDGTSVTFDGYHWDPALGPFFGNAFAALTHLPQENNTLWTVTRQIDPSFANPSTDTDPRYQDAVQLHGLSPELHAEVSQGYTIHMQQYEPAGDGAQRPIPDSDAWISLQKTDDGQPKLVVVRRAESDGTAGLVREVITDPDQIRTTLSSLGGQGLPRRPGQPLAHVAGYGNDVLTSLRSVNPRSIVSGFMGKTGELERYSNRINDMPEFKSNTVSSFLMFMAKRCAALEGIQRAWADFEL